MGFDDFSAFLAIPRVGDLSLSPDGTRLVASVAELNDEGNAFVAALWEIDPAGVGEPRRLTFSDKGEGGAAWLHDGSLLFTSARGDDEEEPAALWHLPAAGGEARKLAARPGGVVAVATARSADTVVLAAPTLTAATDVDDEKKRRAARKEAKATAVLHEVSPVRFWDHDLGPGELRLFATSADASDPLAATELTPAPGRALDEQEFVVSPDGSVVVTGWAVDDEPGFPRPQLVALDVATGQRRVLADEPYVFYSDPAFSYDGRQVACLRVTDSSYDDPPTPQLWVIDVQSGAGRAAAPELDLWPSSVVWSPDGSRLYFTADEKGHAPIFRVELSTGAVTRITASGHHVNVCVAPDGRTVYALRDHIDRPPTPVRIDADAADTDGVPLKAPGQVAPPGRLEQIATIVEDGTTVYSWLALPDGASADAPAPLLLWIHGGPLGSWNAWTWRWNPWLMTARGYAVLLPDPALSTGYGEAMVRRGWGQWGGAPYTDLMAVTDDVIKRADIDEARTAAMGGSYGGYMANWVAGHTDRFRCIVTHASLWALDQFQGTTDHPAYWSREWGLPTDRPERYDEWSPHHHAAGINTPMLVIHGDKDYRVPVGEALRLWWDLQRLSVESKYLYFPDEGHWVLKPGNARVWYETVWAWLGHYVLGEPWERPPLV